MGQMNSSNIQILLPNIYSELFNKEPNTLISKEIKELTHEKFLQIIAELNSLSREYFDNQGKQMIFAVRQGSDQSLLWKAVVEIACIKIDPQFKEVESYRSLTLVELMRVFITLKDQIAAKNPSEESTILDYDKIISNLVGESDLTSECIICLERKNELTLPCTHSFCSQCIEEWNSKHHTCPICRDKVVSTGDSWVLSEKPDAEEIDKEVRLKLLELTKKRNEDSCITS